MTYQASDHLIWEMKSTRETESASSGLVVVELGQERMERGGEAGRVELTKRQARVQSNGGVKKLREKIEGPIGVGRIDRLRGPRVWGRR